MLQFPEAAPGEPAVGGTRGKVGEGKPGRNRDQQGPGRVGRSGDDPGENPAAAPSHPAPDGTERRSEEVGEILADRDPGAAGADADAYLEVPVESRARHRLCERTSQLTVRGGVGH